MPVRHAQDEDGARNDRDMKILLAGSGLWDEQVQEFLLRFHETFKERLSGKLQYSSAFLVFSFVRLSSRVFPPSMVRSFVPLSVRPSVRLPPRWLGHSFVLVFVPSFLRSLARSLGWSFGHSFVPSFVRSFTHSRIYCPTCNSLIFRPQPPYRASSAPHPWRCGSSRAALPWTLPSPPRCRKSTFAARRTTAAGRSVQCLPHPSRAHQPHF